MGFLTWSNVAFFSGAQGLVLGFVMYFLVLLGCRQFDVAWQWRVALTVLAIFAVMAPQVYHLVFQPDPSLFIIEEAMAPAALWLAIKVKFWAGICGHVAGWIVETYFS